MLFETLRNKIILEDMEKENFEYTEYTQQYNIVSKQLLKDFEDIENVENVLEILNFINIKRANRRQDTIESVGYIFLTEVIDIKKILNTFKRITPIELYFFQLIWQI